jgi:outer membrane protein OmpA-like peptidoglycan-associated protein
MISRKTSICATALAFALAGCSGRTHLAEVVPPPPPPPPPAAPAVVPAPGPWGVFFDFDKATLRKEALPILDLVVDTYRRFGHSALTVDGHGDTKGHDAYNVHLGERRADAVKAYLVSKGIPSDRIVTETDGEHDLLIPTHDEVKERRNRRVEIRFGPA